MENMNTQGTESGIMKGITSLPSTIREMKEVTEGPEKTAKKVSVAKKEGKEVGADEARGDGLENSIQSLNAVMDILDKELRFRVDNKTDSVVVQVISEKTGDVIRQIPPEQILAIRSRIDELVGLILDEVV